MTFHVLRSDLVEAWRTHGGRLRDPALWSVVNYRVGRFVARSNNRVVRVVGSRCYGAWSLALDLAAGLQLNREATIGRDLHIVHGWNIKIHPEAVIGARVGIMHDVTIGTTPDDRAAPIIGDDVFIGAGARILGGVRIGDGARIGANTLVISDVPAGTTAVGVPARIVRYTGRMPPTPPMSVEAAVTLTETLSDAARRSPVEAPAPMPTRVPAL